MPRTIDKIITKCNCQYGAPMGRRDVGTREQAEGKIFDCYVPMSDGAYDRGGAYWGLGKPLRVQYDKGLKYVRFYRLGDDLN